MTNIQYDFSPFGKILLVADELGLSGLWFDGAKYCAAQLPAQHSERETPVLSEAMRWLDVYFSGKIRISRRRCTSPARPFRRPFGTFFCAFRMGKRPHMAQSRGSLRRKIMQRGWRRGWTQ